MNGESALVFYTKPWAMTDERTGERKEGLTVEYIMTSDLAPVKNEDGSKGYAYLKQSLNIDVLPKIQEVPGIYDLVFGFKPDSKGKMQVKVVDLDYIGKVNVGAK